MTRRSNLVLLLMAIVAALACAILQAASAGEEEGLSLRDLQRMSGQADESGEYSINDVLLALDGDRQIEVGQNIPLDVQASKAGLWTVIVIPPHVGETGELIINSWQAVEPGPGPENPYDQPSGQVLEAVAPIAERTDPADQLQALEGAYQTLAAQIVATADDITAGQWRQMHIDALQATGVRNRPLGRALDQSMAKVLPLTAPDVPIDKQQAKALCSGLSWALWEAGHPTEEPDSEHPDGAGKGGGEPTQHVSAAQTAGGCGPARQCRPAARRGLFARVPRLFRRR